MDSVSRRTRSKWDDFYRKKVDLEKKRSLDDVLAVDLEGSISSAKSSESKSSDESESSSEEDNNYSDEAYELSEEDSCYEVEKNNGKKKRHDYDMDDNGSSSCNRNEARDKFISIDKSEFLSVNRSCDEKKTRVVEFVGIGENEFCKKRKTGDEVVSIDENEFFSVRDSAIRRGSMKESNEDVVVETSGEMDDKMDGGKSNKSDHIDRVEKRGEKNKSDHIDGVEKSGEKKRVDRVARVVEDEVVSVDENECFSVRDSGRRRDGKKERNAEVVVETSGKAYEKMDGKSNESDHIDRVEKRGGKKRVDRVAREVEDEVVIVDENDFFSVRDSAGRCGHKKESNADVVVETGGNTYEKMDGKLNESDHIDRVEKRGGKKRVDRVAREVEDEVVIVDENELFSVRDSARRRDCKKGSNVDVVVETGWNTHVKMDGKSNKSDHIDIVEKRGGREKVNRVAREVELMKILIDSINARKDECRFSVEKNSILPLRFRFEDEVVVLPPEKSEWEEYVDSFFDELELCWRQIDDMDSSSDSFVKENDDISFEEMNETQSARCGRGEHHSVLDEQIGIVCTYCHAIIMDIKHVLPNFYTRPLSRRRAWREPDESPGSTRGSFQFPDHDRTTSMPTTCVKGTVWELVPGIEQGMFPHQREGFEFIWRNLAGDIVIDNLNQNASSIRGCIISHAPGTGKTRLTIAFLQTFLKMYPHCCPMIIAPKGMLLNWEAEFSKWNFNVPFHNLNKKDLSGRESEVAVSMLKGVGGVISREASRILKLYSWTKDGGILGVSYALFVKLTQEKNKEDRLLHEKMKEMLLECPGLLVLDEGHTPRNDQSLMWQALTKVSTMRRVILSGTPFQNNMLELFNTLSLVNPEFVKQIGCEDHFVRKRWMELTRSIGKSRDDGLRNLRAMLDPFVHVHRGTILEDRLPGLRHTVVFLHPTDCQKAALEEACSKEKNIFRRTRLVSMVSVHPSLWKMHPVETSKIEEDVEAGVKMKFLLKLVWLADALGERVLIFSQFLDPLAFIMKQIERHLSWREDREVLYMDGKLGEQQRQDSISSFNDTESEAKVLLASLRACSEGINLVGASRVVLLDTVWNPSMEKQATSRAYRLGQKKIVHVYRLFTSGVEVRQFARQIKKVQISELIFSAGDGKHCKTDKESISEDKVLEAMLDLEGFNGIFEKVIYQPNESHLIDIFGLEGQN